MKIIRRYDKREGKRKGRKRLSLRLNRVGDEGFLSLSAIYRMSEN